MFYSIEEWMGKRDRGGRLGRTGAENGGRKSRRGKECYEGTRLNDVTKNRRTDGDEG